MYVCIVLMRLVSNDDAVAHRTHQDRNNFKNNKRHAETYFKAKANDKDWHEGERTEIRSKLSTIGKHIRKRGDRVCLQTYRYATYNG